MDWVGRRRSDRETRRRSGDRRSFHVGHKTVRARLCEHRPRQHKVQVPNAARIHRITNNGMFFPQRLLRRSAS